MCRSVSIFQTYAIENFELNLGALPRALGFTLGYLRNPITSEQIKDQLI